MAQATDKIRAKIRLFVEADLGRGAQVTLGRDPAHDSSEAMRLRSGDTVLVFNGRDGEWLAEAGTQAGVLACREQTQAQSQPPDLWLAFAPLMDARTDSIAGKACEMGCRRLIPVLTRLTSCGPVDTARLRAHAIEAAEQCGLMSVPEVAEASTLVTLMEQWDPARRLLFCDESGAGAPAMPAMEVLRAADPGPCPGQCPGPWAILTGPEGGFSAQERARLAALPFAHAVSLGPRTLRADTAAVAALTLWQAVLGDWA